MNNSITFTCWEKDEPLEIQLEPEAWIFKVMPGNEITFTSGCSSKGFKWALRVVHSNNSIQLFPDVAGFYQIEILENGVLMEDWYKYMRDNRIEE